VKKEAFRFAFEKSERKEDLMRERERERERRRYLSCNVGG